jgi:sulfoxide reductase heme-binding subunit YedZ
VIATLSAAHSKEIWYLMRGTGMVSLVLLTATLVAGVAGVRRWSSDGWPRAVVAYLHRNVALLAVVFLAVHIVSAMLDPYVSIGWLAAVVPFISHWKSLWVGLGALAVDAMLALVVTSLLRSHLRERTWRAVHWVAYSCWPLALAHGFTSGTDSSTGWARAVYVVAIVVVAGAVAWRLLPRRPLVVPASFAAAGPVPTAATPGTSARLTPTSRTPTPRTKAPA